MKKTQTILDRTSLDKLLEPYKDKLDSGFIRYVIDYYFLRGRQLGLLDRTAKEATYRKTKRWLQKAYPGDWKIYWKKLRSDMSENLRPYKRLENIKIKNGEIDSKEINKAFKPKSRGRPRLDNLFNATLILLGYFEDKLGSPNWSLMAEVLNTQYEEHEGYDYNSLGNLWFYMKKNYLEKLKIEVNEVNYARDIYDDYLKTKSRIGQ